MPEIPVLTLLREKINKTEAMLYTNLKHIETAEEHAGIVNESENVVVICGRMGSQSIPVYQIAEDLEVEFPAVNFFDMEYDNPESQVIKKLPELIGLASIPYVVYYKNGLVVKVTSGIQSKSQVSAILEAVFNMAVNA